MKSGREVVKFPSWQQTELLHCIYSIFMYGVDSNNHSYMLQFLKTYHDHKFYSYLNNPGVLCGILSKYINSSYCPVYMKDELEKVLPSLRHSSKYIDSSKYCIGIDTKHCLNLECILFNVKVSCSPLLYNFEKEKRHLFKALSLRANRRKRRYFPYNTCLRTSNLSLILNVRHHAL